ncbi:hypothetical protein RHMOL_Rhmol11G0009300 [Rhododendron molle]|uniref:Uncharacterized protein n=1 Tax=Rhododendron molle TaxID=49168 RepID=A0ACC0LMG4_RHOML|nr:hypothetical protein RHMOL_Rhmol11G0009300 [Rhododendron molle]
MGISMILVYEVESNQAMINLYGDSPFGRCLQPIDWEDLIKKGMLQYAKGDKEAIGIDIDPFPMVKVNMVTANLAKKLGSTIERKKQRDKDYVETDEESAKSQAIAQSNSNLIDNHVEQPIPVMRSQKLIWRSLNMLGISAVQFEYARHQCSAVQSESARQ